ncbi:SpoVG family protein [Dehalobacter sp.]|uniref:SpoVG family protein n=1 Tax=Dehalobacter sp. TaxID=1962289 RepID=UPI00338D8B2F
MVVTEKLELDLIRVASYPDSIFKYQLIYKAGNATGMAWVYSFDEEWYYLYKQDTEKYRVKRRKDLEDLKPSFTYKQQRKRPIDHQGKAKSLKKNAVVQSLPMKVEVKIDSIRPSGSVRATATVNLNGCFSIPNIKIIDGSKGLLVAMPSWKTDDGEYKDVCFPVTAVFRQQFNDAVINAYQQAMDMNQNQVPMQEDSPFEEPEQVDRMQMGSM